MKRLLSGLVLLVLCANAVAAGLSDKQRGEQIFKQSCATCHEQGLGKAPKREVLELLSIDKIVLALEIGRMQPQAAHLSKEEKIRVAAFLTDGAETDTRWLEDAVCKNVSKASEKAAIVSAGWGMGTANHRFQSAELAGINAENVGRLTLRWAFGYSKVADARSQPVLTNDTLFVGAKTGHLLALSPDSGCIKWSYRATSSIRSALVLGERRGERVLYFADDLATVYAVRALDGKLIWKQSVSLFSTSIVTGSPVYHAGRLYVPISSYEVAAAGMPGYPCCRSHGGLQVLDVEQGEKLWTWHATDNAVVQGKTRQGAPRWGPSGAVVWTTPTIDSKRSVVYIGTGENMSAPATGTSDAIVALDMQTGKVRWHFQATANDIWNAACLNGGDACPAQPGQDFDFGASVILTQLSNGKDILLAGQKSGEVFALDPDRQGKVLWRKRISQGTTNGGVHWGMAVEGDQVFVPMADPERNIPGYVPRPGLYALDLNTGQFTWQAPVSRSCKFDMAWVPQIGLEQVRSGKSRKLEDRYACSWYYGLSAAATAVPGVVFAGALDGKLRAYNSRNGKVLWQTNTAVPFDTLNGLRAHGGAIDVDGPVIGNGMLFIHSGYSMFGQLPGNVLLAFSVDDAPVDE